MCDLPKNITIEVERDNALRSVEVLIVNHDREGKEVEAVSVYCQDNGGIAFNSKIDLLAYE